jgi:hypothetical protein
MLVENSETIQQLNKSTIQIDPVLWHTPQFTPRSSRFTLLVSSKTPLLALT